MSTARLPRPGEDGGSWGDILNEFLLVSHNADGSLKSGGAPGDDTTLVHIAGSETITGSKNFTGGIFSTGVAVVHSNDARLTNVRIPSDNSVSTIKVQTSSITQPKIATSNDPEEGSVLTWDGTEMTWNDENARTADLAVVATSGSYDDLINKPSIPSDASIVHRSGAETITGEKNFTGALQSSGKAVVVTDDARLSDVRTPSDDSVSTSKVQNASITEPKLAITNSPTDGHFLAWDGSDMKWQAQTASPVTSVSGRTGVISLTKADVGLTDVDDTSDEDKPISIATQTALDDKADSNDARFTNTRIPTDDTTSTIKVQNSAITEPKLAITNSPANGNLLSWDGSDMKWEAPATAPVTSVNGHTGAVTLTKSDVNLSSVDNSADADKPVSTATQTALDAKADTSDVRFSNTRVPTDDTVSTVKIQDSAITEPKLAITNSPANGNLLSWDGSGLKWESPATNDAITRVITDVASNTAAGSTAKTDYIYNVTATATITLPTAVSNTNRYTVTVVEPGVIVTIATTSSQLINGSASAVFSAQYTSYDFVSRGSEWIIR
jgi:hypothetical protein